jgi:hypothetical protein
MTQHSIIEHRANYFYIRLEDDYLAMYEQINEEIEALDLAGRQTSGPADCKAMIASVLEHWTNSKRLTAKCEDDLYVYLTYDEWEQQLRYRYKRSSIIRCLKEMQMEGEWLDDQGEMQVGTIKAKPYVQNTYSYLLNVRVVQALLSKLPDQSPYGPKPKPILGRPKKSRSELNGLKINGINLNGLKTDDIPGIPSKNTSINEEYRLKTNAPFYTQITNTDLRNTQIKRDEPPTIQQSLSSSANASPPHAHLSTTRKRENEAKDEREPEAEIAPAATVPKKPAVPKVERPPRPPREPAPKRDLLAEASPEAQAVVAQWRAIFKRPVAITKTLIEHATTLAAFQPEPGEIAQCRTWMYSVDRNKWYSSHGMHLGDLAEKNFEKFRSLGDMPTRETKSAPEQDRSAEARAQADEENRINFERWQARNARLDAEKAQKKGAR